MPESREDIEFRKKAVKQDLEIYGNSYWYDGERLDPTKFSMFVSEKKSLLPSSSWDRWLAQSQGKKVRVTLTTDPKGKWQTVKVKDILKNKTVIRTGLGSKVVIIIADEAALEGIGSDVPSALGWMATGEEPDNE